MYIFTNGMNNLICQMIGPFIKYKNVNNPIKAKSLLQVKMDSDGGADGRSSLWGGGEASDEGEEGSRGRGQLALGGREGSHPH